jgi:plasmid stabilization system protein ParE
LSEVRLRGRARRELREAIAWYRERNSDVADRFIAEVQQTLTHLENLPETGSFVPGVANRNVRRLPVHNFPYQIVFIRLARHIAVLAIAHDRRRPGYWTE